MVYNKSPQINRKRKQCMTNHNSSTWIAKNSIKFKPFVNIYSSLNCSHTLTNHMADSNQLQGTSIHCFAYYFITILATLCPSNTKLVIFTFNLARPSLSRETETFLKVRTPYTLYITVLNTSGQLNTS